MLESHFVAAIEVGGNTFYFWGNPTNSERNNANIVVSNITVQTETVSNLTLVSGSRSQVVTVDTMATIATNFYGGTPTLNVLAGAGGGLLTSAQFVGKPYDRSFLLTFTASGVTQATFTNLFQITLSRAASTNFVNPTFSITKWGAFTNTATGASSIINKLYLSADPASPSNSIIGSIEASALSANNTYTICVHVDQP